ncbi:MAG: GGDEF domain-containing protein, partial [Aquabacterium sp.]|uniref:GGDEF domain-containing protein n=1 Tax=Aquabacterium sp. TaxID=1872578 RepID=UPI00121CF4CA
ADLALLLKSEGIDIGLLTTGLMAAHRARWRPSFDRWIPWVFGLITAVKVGTGFMLHSPVLAINQVYITLMVLVIGMLALQLPIRAGIRGCLLGGLPFLALPWVSDIHYGLLFLGHYLLTATVAMFVVAVREDKDRMMFLQSMRFQQERQEVQRLNAELDDMARKDALTGLANRRVFDEALRAEWDRARRNRASLALLMIDVDHFKRFNDRYGHPAGDRCLAEVAAAIASVVRRPGDVAARYGGEEFVILLPDTDATGACELARRVIEQVDAARMVHEDSPTTASVTVSVGVSHCLPHGPATAQGLTDAADGALYEAKSAGRHRFVCRELRVAGTP